MKFITIFSDASHHPDGSAGYAYFVRDEKTIVKESHGLPWKANRSTDVEEFAMCHAILRAVDLIPHEPGDTIVAQTDCTHVIHRFQNERSTATDSVLRILGDAWPNPSLRARESSHKQQGSAVVREPLVRHQRANGDAKVTQRSTHH